MSVFQKRLDCPSSFALLEFSESIARSKVASTVSAHLGKCDFCSAEVELYMHFPPGDIVNINCEIPEHLYELADSIFKRTAIVFKTASKHARKAA
ncbi:MAG: hypothetical protein DMF62_06520 [Acidobacteria bacterium]|nr:MAG: hypothetical protein DMF62_06520 [Acidobacteriota bacterium]